VIPVCGDNGGNLSKIGSDFVVAVHGDVGAGNIGIGNDAHIASSVNKLVAFISHSHKWDYKNQP
jgi:hypothetical protein